MVWGAFLLQGSLSSDFWSDPRWQAWGVIVAVIGIFVTWWLFLKGRQRKEISYSVISEAPILNLNKDVEEDVKAKVEIRFAGQPVKSLSLLVLKVWNTGNTAITRDDYEEPITFDFAGRTVIESEILTTTPEGLIKPPDLKTALTHDLTSVTISKFLLNPKEAITLKALLTGTPGKINARARIVNGKLGPRVVEEAIKPLNIKISSSLRSLLYICLLFVGIVGGVGFLANLNSLESILPPLIFNIIVYTIMILFFLFALSFIIYTISTRLWKLYRRAKRGIKVRW